MLLGSSLRPPAPALQGRMEEMSCSFLPAPPVPGPWGLVVTACIQEQENGAQLGAAPS